MERVLQKDQADICIAARFLSCSPALASQPRHLGPTRAAITTKHKPPSLSKTLASGTGEHLNGLKPHNAVFVNVASLFKITEPSVSSPTVSGTG